MNNIYVNCGGNLMVFDSKEETLDFFEECILMSEGSERDRYTNIYFSVKSNLNSDRRCFTDGTSHVYISELSPDNIDYYEESLLRTNYGIDKNDLLMFKANTLLAYNFDRIYETTMNRYEDPDDLYESYLKDKDQEKFYYIDRDAILCFDTSCKGKDKYWIEEFPLKDYIYANKWLKEEIEYSQYLESIKEVVKEEGLEL